MTAMLAEAVADIDARAAEIERAKQTDLAAILREIEQSDHVLWRTEDLNVAESEVGKGAMPAALKRRRARIEAAVVELEAMVKIVHAPCRPPVNLTDRVFEVQDQIFERLNALRAQPVVEDDGAVSPEDVRELRRGCLWLTGRPGRGVVLTEAPPWLWALLPLMGDLRLTELTDLRTWRLRDGWPVTLARLEAGVEATG